MARDAAAPHPVRIGAVTAVGAIVLLLVVVWLATQSTTLAWITVVLTGGLVVTLAAGLVRTGTALNILGVFVAPMTGLTLPGGASFVTFTDLFLLLGFALLAPTLLGRRLHLPWAFVIGGGVLFLGSTLGSLMSASPVTSLNLMMRVMIALLFLPLLFAWWRPSPRVLTMLAGAYVLGVCANVASALFLGGRTEAGRYTGLAETPTAMGYASVLGLSILPFLLTVASTRLSRVFWAGTALTCLLGIWISGSRTGLVVLVVLALIYPVVERSLKVTLALVAMGGLLAANLNRLLDQNGGTNALARLLGGSGADRSDQARIDGLQDALAVFREHPLMGNGYNFENFLAHNLYVQVLACAGIIGLLAFLILLWSFVEPLFRVARPWGLLAYPALTYVVAGPITPNLGSRYVTVVLGLSIVIATSDAFRKRSEPDEEPPERSVNRPAAGAHRG